MVKKAHDAEKQKDIDVQFIALWVAFNAAYAKALRHTSIASERSNFKDFLNLICRLDKEKRLYTLVWNKFSGSIRMLLDNRYVFQPFWDFHNGLISQNVWLDNFDNAKKRASMALAKQDTEAVLVILFDRLYTLRNQMVHGGATYQSSANRQQIQDACALLSETVLLILWIMMSQPENPAWGEPFYPFIQQ